MCGYFVLLGSIMPHDAGVGVKLKETEAIILGNPAITMYFGQAQSFKIEEIEFNCDSQHRGHHC